MAKTDREYTEIIRIPVSDKTDTTVSWVWENGGKAGIVVGGYTRTPKYTGRTEGAHFIPKEKLAEFKAAIANL